MVKNLLASARDSRVIGLSPVLGRSPGEGNGEPAPVLFLPGKFHGQRSLADYVSTCAWRGIKT